MNQIQFRDREPPINLVFYRLFKWSIINPLLYTYFQCKVYGVEKVPRSKPLIVVSNHASYFDPPILSVCIRRPVAYMAKEELFEVPLLKQGIELYGAYPVKRSSADRSAIRAAINALENGWAAGLFLEGTRTPDGRIRNPKLGAATIAAKTQIPILPVCLWGTDKILPKGSSIPKPVPITVRIGDLIEPPRSKKKEELIAVTQKCTMAIETMHDLGR